MDIKLLPLTKNDTDMTKVKEIHNEPSIAKYISISDAYFDYVTNTKNVVYYKINVDGKIVGGVHCEISDCIMHISICIMTEYQNRGLGFLAVKILISMFCDSVTKICVSIDESNLYSQKLFERLGFKKTNKEEELIEYCLFI